MKETDIKLLRQLRRNARESITNISKKTGIPTSTVFLKIREQENRLIKKHVSLVDYAALGYNHWQNTVVKLAEYNNKEFEKFLLEYENVNSLYEINGGYDYLLETVHKNVKEYVDFMKDLENKFKIVELKGFQIINDLKREEFFSKGGN
ncbi:MAG: Lrp/AsnC family transcriptional regulator [Nanoarchaeota archaeon]|nr:Lrp/AsnC family transcriptional regulator [Nanoarchaeota archaeon]MBU1030735.1 Lrp/AsnC family transcriptional regulator [Nanoarchaeota archaeon]MBU1850604.1 Lrp/AsnC family transcriptional regulator [Nanoarchaeota archaeon]